MEIFQTGPVGPVDDDIAQVKRVAEEGVTAATAALNQSSEAEDNEVAQVLAKGYSALAVAEEKLLKLEAAHSPTSPTSSGYSRGVGGDSPSSASTTTQGTGRGADSPSAFVDDPSTALKLEGNRLLEAARVLRTDPKRGRDADEKAAAAAEAYSRALAAGPRFISDRRTLYANRSSAHAARRDYAAALTDAETAAELDPMWPGAPSRRGAALGGLGRFEEASEAYRMAAARASDEGSRARYAELARAAAERAAAAAAQKGAEGAAPGAGAAEEPATPYAPPPPADGAKPPKAHRRQLSAEMHERAAQAATEAAERTADWAHLEEEAARLRAEAAAAAAAAEAEMAKEAAAAFAAKKAKGSKAKAKAEPAAEAAAAPPPPPPPADEEVAGVAPPAQPSLASRGGQRFVGRGGRGGAMLGRGGRGSPNAWGGRGVGGSPSGARPDAASPTTRPEEPPSPEAEAKASPLAKPAEAEAPEAAPAEPPSPDAAAAEAQTAAAAAEDDELRQVDEELAALEREDEGAAAPAAVPPRVPKPPPVAHHRRTLSADLPPVAEVPKLERAASAAAATDEVADRGKALMQRWLSRVDVAASHAGPGGAPAPAASPALYGVRPVPPPVVYHRRTVSAPTR